MVVHIHFRRILLLLLHLLVVLSQGSGAQNYEAIGRKAFGWHAQLVTTVLVSILTWLALIAYSVLIGDLLEPVFALFGVAVGVNGRKLLLLGVIALVSPMCFQRTLNALKWCSLITVCSIMVVTAAIVYRASAAISSPSRLIYSVDPTSQYVPIHLPANATALRLFPDSWLQAVYVFPVFGVAFMCHFNALPVHTELERPTLSRVRGVFNTTMAVGTVVYLHHAKHSNILV